MKVLCTFPGRHGDLIWALPTVRAISEVYGRQMDLMTSEKYAKVLPLAAPQDYINKTFANPNWDVQETAPMTPWIPQDVGADPRFRDSYDKIIHLGYRQWPKAPTLAQEINDIARIDIELPPLDLGRPWLEVPAPSRRRAIVVGFTDEYAEMKAGLVGALAREFPHEVLVLTPPGGSRLGAEWAWGGVATYPCDFLEAAELIAGAKVFVGCLSSLAVIAAGLGKARILIEPNKDRHHPVFSHWDTPLVKGGNGLPTFDARALVTAVREKLETT